MTRPVDIRPDHLEVESQKAPPPTNGDGVKQEVCSDPSIGDTAACSGAAHAVTSSRWREAKLGDITELLSGGTPSKSCGDYWNGSVPWVSAKDMKRLRLYETEDLITQAGVENGTRMVPANTVLVLVRGMTLLKDVPVSIAQRPMAFNQDIKAIRPKSEVDENFLPYLILGNRARILSLVDLAGHGTGRLNTAELKALRVNIPTRSEQRAIARVLGTLDDKIELNRRMNQTLEAMAQVLFKSWFVDFEPVRAKIEGRWRRGESLPGLPDGLYDLFPDRLVGSELGEVPEGWEVKPLSDCIDLARGLSYKGSGLASTGIPMHNLNSIYEGGGYKEEGIKYYNGNFQDRHVTQPGDVLVANTEQGHDRLLIGFAAIVPTRFGDKGLFSHHIYRVRAKGSAPVTPDFICQLLNTRPMQGTVSGYATGTTVNMLPLDALRIPSIVMPHIQLIQAFSTIAEATRIRQSQVIEESRSLVAQRDVLLPDLVTGKVRVDSIP